jgi:hypothetical protein
MDGNAIYLQKAQQSVADFANGGKVSDQQLKSFIKLAIDKSDLLPMFRHETFTGTKFEIPQAGFLDRVVQPGGERKVLSEDERAKATFTKPALEPKNFKAEWPCTYDMLEDNIEQGTFLDNMKAGLAEKAGEELAEILLMSDTANTALHPSLRVIDGIFKKVTANTVDAGGERFGKTVMEQMLRKQPRRYSSKPKLSFLCSHKAQLDYAFSLGSRGTAEGDRALLAGMDSPKFIGIPVNSDPFIPENLGGTTDRSLALLGNMKMVWVGWKREMTVQVVDDPRAGEIVVILRFRVDVQVERDQAFTKATNILTP